VISVDDRSTPRPCATRRGVLSALLALAAATLLPAPAHAAEQQRILVFGDSQAQGLAGGLQRHFRGDRDVRVLDRSKISTGLNPRASFDWPAQAKTLADTEKADVAFALFGANDRPPVRIDGNIDYEKWQRYADAYGAKITAIAQAFKRAGIPLVWVGHPIVRDPAYAEDMVLLNDLYAARTAAEGVPFVSTWDMFKGPDGEFNAYGKGLDGKQTRLRADDGVHLTPPGYDVLTQALLPYIERYRHPAATAAQPAGPAGKSAGG
jgi:uncharacterized protein